MEDAELLTPAFSKHHLRAINARKRDKPLSLDSNQSISAPVTRQVLTAADRLIIFEAIEQLDEHERELFDLEQAGLTYAEIGEALGKIENAVGCALTRIRSKLRVALEDYKHT